MKTIITVALVVAATAARAHGHHEVELDGHEFQLFTAAHHVLWFAIGVAVGAVGATVRARRPQEVPCK
jgi:hypothetical protein